MDKIHRPSEVKKEDLKKIYDVFNKVFKKKECFYTKEEIKKLKENKENVFI